MLTPDRLAQIAGLVDRASKRMDGERAFALLRACEDLLEEVRRLTPVQRLLLEEVS